MGPSADGAPRLETERLLLRPHHPDDLAACLALWADPAVTRHCEPLAAAQVEANMTTHPKLWASAGYGFWVVEEKSTGRFLGEVGFIDLAWERPSLSGIPEMGGDARGRGLGEGLRHRVRPCGLVLERPRTAAAAGGLLHPGR